MSREKINKKISCINHVSRVTCSCMTQHDTSKSARPFKSICKRIELPLDRKFLAKLQRLENRECKLFGLPKRVLSKDPCFLAATLESLVKSSLRA